MKLLIFLELIDLTESNVPIMDLYHGRKAVVGIETPESKDAEASIKEM